MNARSGTIALAALAFGGVALLTAAPAAAAPGDNGTVDIREVGSTTAAPTQADAGVCNFYLDAAGFETVTQATWQIAADPAQPGGETRSGTISLTAGAGVTAAVTPQLPNGTYKLTWSFLGQEVQGKEKTFQVACPGNGDVTTDQAPAVAGQPAAVQPAVVQPAADLAPADDPGASADFGGQGNGDDEGRGGGREDGGRDGGGRGGDWGDDDSWGGDNWGRDEGGYGSGHHNQHHGNHHFWPNSGPHTGVGGSIAAASTGEIAAGGLLAAGAVAGGGLFMIRTARRRRDRTA